MPWSRTRAYPHAFAVPDSKMGGSYNYMARPLLYLNHSAKEAETTRAADLYDVRPDILARDVGSD